MKHAIVVILLAAGLVSVVRADEIENYRQMIAQQKAQQQGYVKRLRQLPGKKKIEDILRIISNQGKLELQSPLFAEAQGLKNQQVRAEVEGFEGDCTISVQQIGNTGNYFFAFSNSSYPLLQGVSNFAVRLQPGTLTISRSFNSRTKNGTINLVQSHGRAMYGPLDGVQLTIYGSDNTGRVTVNINLLEPDFPTLLRKHPREVDQYLRPLLRELKLDSLFAVDETTAWQVFTDEWKGNADIAAKVERLLPELDRDNYAAREAARQELIKLGPQAALVIYGMDRGKLSAEQRCQLDSMLTLHAFLSRKEAHRLQTDVDFLLDCLYSSDGVVRQIAARRLERAVKHSLPLDPAMDYETRVKQIETLRGQLGRGATTQASNKG